MDWCSGYDDVEAFMRVIRSRNRLQLLQGLAAHEEAVTLRELGADVGGRIQSRGASYGSGGGSELTDRPVFAEEVIFASVCAKLQTWAQETED